MADADLFAAQWGLDEAARLALLQLEPELQAKVVQDFAPKPGTRDVNRLFHGFMKSVKTAAVSYGVQPLAAEGTETCSTPEPVPASADANLPGQSWIVQTDMIDVEAFLSRWGLDEAAHAMIVEQTPEVQARVMAEFAPKPGTRDVNRLLHGFIKSVRNCSTLPPSANQYAEVVEEDSRGAASTHSYTLPQDQYSGEKEVAAESIPNLQELQEQRSYAAPPQQQLFHRSSRGLFREPTPALPSSTPSTEKVLDISSFVVHWSLDAAAQAALQQLAPEVQAKVLVDFSPKPGTRDVNRLFHGFIRSVQTAVQAPLFGAGRSARPATAPLGMGAARPTNSAAYATEVVDPEPVATGLWGTTGSPSPSASTPSTDPVSETARLQAFVDHWGLDAGSVAALVQLDPAAQRRVVLDFSPKPQTQDVNRLFRGWVRSLTNSTGHLTQRVYRLLEPATELQSTQADTERKYTSLYTSLVEAYEAEALTTPEVSQEDYSGYNRSSVAGAESQGAVTDGFAADYVAYGVPAVMATDGYKQNSAAIIDGSEEPPTREELAAFARGWNLGDEILLALEGQSASVQRRVLDQFRPKPGTRDVRSLFYGFLRSIATGGPSKRQRML